MSTPAELDAAAKKDLKSRTNNILEGLPIKHLIATPFIEAAEAQKQLAFATTSFIKDACVDKDGKIIMVDMTYDTADASGTTMSHIKVPLLTILNVPSLLIQKMSVDFKIEILDIVTVDNVVKKDNTSDLGVNVGASWSGWGAKVNVDVKYATTAKISQTSSSKDSISTKSEYQVHVEAAQNMPPGLTQLLDTLTKSVSKNASA